MNYAMIGYMLGWVCCFEGGFLLLPLLVALIYGEIQVGAAYGIIAVLCLILGAVVVWRKPENHHHCGKGRFGDRGALLDRAQCVRCCAVYHFRGNSLLCGCPV